MKQLFQDMSNGVVEVIESPAPQFSEGNVIISSSVSLISAGTERMLVDFGRASYLDKAKQQPEKVKMVLEKIQTDGLLTTIDAVRAKLSEPLPLGYCNVGVVTGVGAGISNIKEGDRVVSNGPHADVVRIAKNLCAKIPENVSDEEAAFTIVASIGLQGVRLANPTLGEAFVVTGVGLIGLLTVQLLRAHGCRVLAIDFDDSKLALAARFGAETCNPGKGQDPIAAGLAFSRNHGVDGVIITASTKDSDPVVQAARMSRKRGRIILVGVTGLELNRADFYEKELSFQVSCSYGPGRYDPFYEERGNDYPIGFVRWTEQRNFEAVLDVMASGQLDVKPLITHRFNFEDAPKAYDALISDRSALGIILEYSNGLKERHINHVTLSTMLSCDPKKPTVGFIGAGNYASRMLIPAFKRAGAQLHTISTSGGVSGVIHGKKAKFAYATTDTERLFRDSDINTIAVVTRHNSHATFVAKALEAGKHVFVEKPLSIDRAGIELVRTAYERQGEKKPILMVGFNRRFSPHVQKIKSLLTPLPDPKAFIITVNAGAIPADHWTQDAEIGGGRIIGEACHFIDLMRFLSGSKVVSVQAFKVGEVASTAVTEDKATITLGFADGSFGTIHYLANGASSFPKERVEVFVEGKVLQLDNFRTLRGFGWSGFKKMSLWRQDKGQDACVASFLAAIQSGELPPIPADEIFEVAAVTIDASEQLRSQ